MEWDKQKLEQKFLNQEFKLKNIQEKYDYLINQASN